MKLRSSIVWIVVFLLSVSMASIAAQRGNQRGNNNNNPQNGGGGRGNRGNNPPNGTGNEGNNPRGRGNLPPEGSVRDDSLKVTNKPRVMLEIVDMLQRRTGRPIAYEDPMWAYEGIRQIGPDGRVLSEAPGDIKRTPGFRDVSKPNAPVKDLLSLTPGTFEFRLAVDARTHLLPEPIDGSIGAVLTAVIADYKAKQLPGSFAYGYLGDVNTGGFGWMVVPDKFRDKGGKEISPPPRVLDYPISFPMEERPTLATFQLITELVSKASGQQVQLKKLASESNVTGNTGSLKTVELPAKQFVRIGANNETARSVIAKALRNIERGDPRTQGPIPQRTWRLLYSIEARAYYLDVVDVRQETYQIDGRVTGTKPVNWPSSPSSPSPTAAVQPTGDRP